MDNLSAFGMGVATHGFMPKMFDWYKAIKLIKEKKPSIVRSGLRGDWENTGGIIYQTTGKLIKKGDLVGIPDSDYGMYFESTWATPEIEIDGEIMECYKMANECPEDWGGEKAWPQSAKKKWEETNGK